MKESQEKEKLSVFFYLHGRSYTPVDHILSIYVVLYFHEI